MMDEMAAAMQHAPRESAVFLDLDGTIAPIVQRPEDVKILPAIRDLLPELRETFGLVAFISGRARQSLRDVVQLEGVAYSGNHGIEVELETGEVLPAAVAPERLSELDAFARRWSSPALERLGIWLEHKGSTLTFHYRTSQTPQAAQRYLQDLILPGATARGLMAEPGRRSLEVHPAAAIHKGSAADALLDARPQIRQVISFGDDRTDTEVWGALASRLAGGKLARALAVGVISNETPDVVLRTSDVQVQGVEGTERALRMLLAHTDA
jgi:trehalose 6-phosphate phosphatase